MIKTLGDRIEEIKKDSRLKIDEFVALLGVSKQSYNGCLLDQFFHMPPLSDDRFLSLFWF